ncbi:MAG: hypothetical protein ISR58_07220 [Anaerolineales bacterium]|nr:hypothetical protein [Chloroflexota bacterium]MBL6980966.1 hypothetical protein [Anaerolineales bacterium]
MGDKEQTDLGYIEAALDELETYLHSGDLFGSLRGYQSLSAIPFPHLTLGGLLLALKRSRSRTLSAKNQSRLGHFQSQLETLHTKWRVAWEKKATKEYRSRLRQWANYLNDLQGDADEYADYYGQEVRLRVMLELLADDAREILADDVNILTSLDQRLLNRFVQDSFIWDEELSEGFSKERFWFLWGKLI